MRGLYGDPPPDAEGPLTGILVLDLTRAELETLLVEAGFEAYRARQLWHWVYQRGATDWSAMTTVGAAARVRLAERFRIHSGNVTESHNAADGTRKWVVHYSNSKANVETVFIPEVDRGTACLSSQGAEVASPAADMKRSVLSP